MANILAVDDNIELCKLIRTALERDGHRVETRLSGAELTEQLCHWADCILLDVMMPGEDGFAVCRRIRGLTDAQPLQNRRFVCSGRQKQNGGIGQATFCPSPSGWQSCAPGWRRICGGRTAPRCIGWCAAGSVLTCPRGRQRWEKLLCR